VIVTSRLHAPSETCGYLPEERWRLEYLHVAELTAAEYGELLVTGWRRFGRWVFRPRCATCRACRSLRVDVAAFRPDRSQKRARRANEPDIQLRIGPPEMTLAILRLSAVFHRDRATRRGWLGRIDDPGSFAESFLDNPFPTEQWRFQREGRLIGLGHVDALPVGLSAIYFVHDPAEHRRGLGTWNVLCLIEEARRRGLPHVYLGYHVAGCPSLAYKARFRPYQLLDPDGRWVEPSGSAAIAR
jgi:arginine-tRNA-protein transferase